VHLADLRNAGKVRHVGLCNVSAAQLVRAQAIVPIASVQVRYHLADRTADDLLALCEREGIAFLPWSPLADGALAGADVALASLVGGVGPFSVRNLLTRIMRFWPAVIPAPRRSRTQRSVWSLIGPGGRLHQIATGHNVTPGQTALSWLLRRCSSVLPIPGTSSIDHLEQNVAAAEVRLTEDEFRELSRF
jgi:pyridoxine 4-dehydrogenase